jgi:ParG
MPRVKRDERLNITISETLKRQFDVVCAIKGISMSDAAQQAIMNWVKENSTDELLKAIGNIPTEEHPPAVAIAPKSGLTATTATAEEKKIPKGAARHGRK